MSARLRAAMMHGVGSAVIGASVFYLVFFYWFPKPFDQLTGGRSLFTTILSVDLICGPLLTFVVFNTLKPRSELLRDILTIIALQLGALLYGLWSVFLARPVYVGFEGDRFRVVTAIEMQGNDGGLFENIRCDLPCDGPRYVGVKLLTPGEPLYLQSIQNALHGLHPSMQPSRVLPYNDVAAKAAESARPFSELDQKAKAQGAVNVLRDALSRIATPEADIGYFPLISRWRTDWVLLVDRRTGAVLGPVSVDGW